MQADRQSEAFASFEPISLTYKTVLLILPTIISTVSYNAYHHKQCPIKRCCRHNPISTALKLGIVMSRSEKSFSRRDFLCKTLSLIHISEPTRLGMISYAVF